MSKVENSFLDRMVAYSVSGGLPILIIFVSLVLGALALNFTPREEEPQIVVPMIDIAVQAPGMSAKQVERQVTYPLEKLLSQIKGVEHVYSSSMTGKTIVTLRFYVGEDREDAILNTYNKLYSNQDEIITFDKKLNKCISNNQMKFEGQSYRYKQDTGLTILCHVNKARALFLST